MFMNYFDANMLETTLDTPNLTDNRKNNLIFKLYWKCNAKIWTTESITINLTYPRLFLFEAYGLLCKTDPYLFRLVTLHFLVNIIVRT